MECRSNSEPELEPESEAELGLILIDKSKWLRAQRLQSWITEQYQWSNFLQIVRLYPSPHTDPRTRLGDIIIMT